MIMPDYHQLPKVDCLERVTVNRSFQIELNADDIRLMMKDAGYEIPADAEFVFRVPGGADWSNCDLDIDAENPVCVRWQTREETP